MRVLVTGARGYLGAHIADFLMRGGHEVIGSMRTLTPPAGDERVFKEFTSRMQSVVVGDLRERSVLDSLSKGPGGPHGLDAVVHTVSLNHQKSEEDPGNTLSTNVGVTWELLRRLTSQNPKLRFVYFSTFHVYGRTGAVKIDESTKTAPLNAYALTHLFSEELVRSFSRSTGMVGHSIRLSNGFGAPAFRDADCWWLVLNDFCKTALSKKRIEILSDGTAQRDFIHVDDIAASVGLLLRDPRGSDGGDVYNVASGRTYTILELALIVQKTLERDFEMRVPITVQGKIYEDSTVSPVAKFECDSSKLRSLGFQPKKTIEDGVREIVRFIQARGTP